MIPYPETACKIPYPETACMTPHPETAAIISLLAFYCF